MVATQTTIKVDERHRDYAERAMAVGCPRDQTKNFMVGGYVAFPEMLPFHAAARLCDRPGGPDAIGLGGTRGPGKSHAVLAQVGLDDCQRAPGIKFLFLRKIMKSAAESLEDLTYKVFRYVNYDFHPAVGRVIFPNGSRILIGGFHDESDIDKYLGIEYDGLAIEEATQISERKMDMISGSVRSTRSDWRARKYMTTNADGIGLQWFKRDFIIPWRTHKEAFTRFIPANYKNNPFLKEEYIRYLEGLQGALGRAWRDADWDAFEGMALPNWDHDRHVIKPIEIPESWVRWRAIDWGYAKPWTCGWFAKHPDTGRVIVYREAYQVLLTDQQQARRIVDLTLPGEIISVSYADPSMWERKNKDDVVYTTADEYKDNGVPLVKANNDRIGGKRKIDSLLGDLPDGLPGLQIFDNCVNLIRTLPTLIRDERQPEDVDTTQEDHSYDMLRYGLTNTRLKQVQAQPEKEVHPLGRYKFL